RSATTKRIRNRIATACPMKAPPIIGPQIAVGAYGRKASASAATAGPIAARLPKSASRSYQTSVWRPDSRRKWPRRAGSAITSPSRRGGRVASLLAAGAMQREREERDQRERGTGERDPGPAAVRVQRTRER